MTGILVHGDNHFIVRGPMPDPGDVASIGSSLVGDSDRRSHRPIWIGGIVTREFRES